MVTEHGNPANIPLEQQDAKEWETGLEVAKELNDDFNENKLNLQITRKGLDTNTKYRIVPMTSATTATTESSNSIT